MWNVGYILGLFGDVCFRGAETSVFTVVVLDVTHVESIIATYWECCVLL